jgi:hypothetical protein
MESEIAKEDTTFGGRYTQNLFDMKISGFRGNTSRGALLQGN